MKALAFSCSNGHEFYSYDLALYCPYVVESQPCEGSVTQVGAKAKAAKS
ncbi:MAG TPA: hypothetical protein VMZ51_07980 [Acidimicrobiales bacterium]|nr:hypothetical protein [Acidimicrobiales bacterium]